MSKQKKPKRDNRRLIMAIMAGVMALLMLLPMLTMILQSAGAAPSVSDIKDSISDLQGSQKDLAAQIKKLTDDIKAIQNDKSKALQQKQLLDQQVAAKEEEIKNTEAIIREYDQLIADQQVQLDETKVKEQQQYELFCQRVRSMEEAGTVSYWSILFDSSDFSDLLDRATFVSEVMEYDNAVMDELAATRAKIEGIMTDLQASQDEQQAQKDTLVVQKADLDAKVADAQALVKKMQGQESEYKAAQDALKKEEDEVEAQIKKKQKELQAAMAAGTINFDPGTGWQWPVEGCYTITSTYGPRIHPITGKPGNHTGTDVAAPRNTPIKSARGGVVTISTYNNSYGNYVVVDHGDGYATLYAHMNSRAVKEGQVVKQGQVLGYVGTTGSSTGYHLHYELRVNGGRADVLEKYPSMKFTYR
ncbi:MAG: peptidase M23 [Clostridia bacterium]|nr:peptidase M23 [Clostridia bacterium]